MPRLILRKFVERALLLALPLAGCGNDLPATDLAVTADLAVECENAHAPQILTLPGRFADGGQPSDCYLDGPCSGACPTGFDICCVLPSDDDMGSGPLRLACFYDCGGAGRRPEGLAPATASAACVVGAHWAQTAHLEAASVHAFARLGRELAEHGAPLPLRQAARRAQRDEIRHARVTARLARAHGARPPRLALAPVPARSLADIAVENAVEGCVGETFGALVAAWQARSAADAHVRRAMGDIAGDELAHAELAWAVDAWAQRRLDRAARRRVQHARHTAAADLEARLRQPPARLRQAAGLPPLAVARRLAAEARRALWRA